MCLVYIVVKLVQFRIKGLDMALIKCGECGAEVSDKASACVKCGAPITQMKEEQRVTTQETGKPIKAYTLMAVIVLIVGMLMWISAVTGSTTEVIGKVLFFAGLGLFFVFRSLAWWEHG